MKKKIFLTPHAHYDVVWAFNRQDYFFIYTSILKKAMRMIREGNFKFLIEQSYPLEMMEQQNPELYAEVEEQILADKVEIVDGQYIMADPIIPGAEVLVREILHGKRYIKERFGKDVPVAWAADGFGLNAQMPQVYKKAGYKWLAFRRGLPRSIGTRVSEFYWEGLDGTKILAHWLPMGYRAGLWLDKWRESVDLLNSLATTDNILMPCGSGGAIPQEDIPETLKRWNETNPDLEMVMATPGDFFRALDGVAPELITFRGELYSDELENIFPDVASSRIRLRLAIRHRELDLILAEKVATLAYLAGRRYPTDSLSDSWKKMMFLAMHDVIPGTGIDEIYDEAWEYIDEMRKRLPQIMRDSVTHLTPGTGRGVYVVVFNPLNWEVSNWVEADVELGEGWSDAPGIRDNGKDIPCEIEEMSRWDDKALVRVRIGFKATVPPLGCRVYSVTRSAVRHPEKLRVTEDSVENDYYRVHVDRTSGILSVFDKEGKMLVTGNQIIIDEELGDLYFHRSLLEKAIGAEGGGGLHFGTFKPIDYSIHNGASRAVITFRNSFYCLRWPYYLTEKYGPLLYRHKTIDVTKHVIVYEDIPRIDLITNLNLVQSHVRIRLCFDTGMVTPQLIRHTQFGVLEMPIERTMKESTKVPSLSWIAAEQEGRGVAFLTRGVPINELRSGQIFYTLVRSVSVLAADGKSGPLVPVPKAQELGEHSFHYSIYPYEGNWRDQRIYLRGFEMNQPLRAFQAYRLPNKTECRSFTIEPDNIILSALKLAEDGKNVIMRFFESRGESCVARVGLTANVKQVKLTNLLEEEEKELEIKDRSVTLELGPFEIITLKLII